MRTTVMIVLGIALVAMPLGAFAAGNGKGGGTRDRKRDGTCQGQFVTPQQGPQLLARYGNGNGKGNGKGDRKRDGSCASV